MALFTARRAGNRLTLSLDFTTRFRSISLSFSSSDHGRISRGSCRNYSRADFRPPFRAFSSRTPLKQEVGVPLSTSNSSSPTPPQRPVTTPSRSSQSHESFSPVGRTASSKILVNSIRKLQDGLLDEPQRPFHSSDVSNTASSDPVDWSRSFQGLSEAAFSKEAAGILLAPIPEGDIEIKPDGIIYLPEIKYRRILNRAFGPGAWGLAPRSETIVTAKAVTREYALLAHGRLVSIARGEQDYFDSDGIPTATEGCKSNALMRCCKDLGVASELWDPRFIHKWIAGNAKEVWVEHQVTKKKRKIFVRKGDHVRYPFKEVLASVGTATSSKT